MLLWYVGNGILAQQNNCFHCPKIKIAKFTLVLAQSYRQFARILIKNYRNKRKHEQVWMFCFGISCQILKQNTDIFVWECLKSCIFSRHTHCATNTAFQRDLETQSAFKHRHIEESCLLSETIVQIIETKEQV